MIDHQPCIRFQLLSTSLKQYETVYISTQYHVYLVFVIQPDPIVIQIVDLLYQIVVDLFVQQNHLQVVHLFQIVKQTN